jgi:hypothetical protein
MFFVEGEVLAGSMMTIDNHPSVHHQKSLMVNGLDRQSSTVNPAKNKPITFFYLLWRAWLTIDS